METLVKSKEPPLGTPQEECAVDTAVVLNLLYISGLLAEVMDEEELAKAVSAFRQRGKIGNTSVS